MQAALAQALNIQIAGILKCHGCDGKAVASGTFQKAFHIRHIQRFFRQLCFSAAAALLRRLCLFAAAVFFPPFPSASYKFPVFIRSGYAVPLHADGMDSLGKPVSQNLNSKLILLVAGAAGKSTFTTNKSVLTCEWKNEKIRVEGTGAETVQIHHFC